MAERRFKIASTPWCLTRLEKRGVGGNNNNGRRLLLVATRVTLNGEFNWTSSNWWSHFNIENDEDILN